MPRLPWIERTWAFDFPPGLYPSLLERLRGTPVRLEERVAGLDRDTLVAREGKAWSIQEHAGHLWDLEYLPRVRLDEFLSGAQTLTAADMTNRRTHEAEHGSRSMSDILAGFRAERRALVERLEALEPEDFSRTGLHPRLKTPMRLVDMCLFHADHDDHHLATITDLIRRSGK